MTPQVPPSPAAIPTLALSWRQAWRGVARSSVRLTMGLQVVAVVVALAAVLVTAWALLAQAAERAQEQAAQQQAAVAQLWANALSVRLESQQRLLAVAAQSMQTSLIRQPAVLEALQQQEGSVLRSFDSLYVALASGSISHYARPEASGGLVVEVGSQIDQASRAALRRTLADGKPLVTQVDAIGSAGSGAGAAEAPQLPLLLTVPLRQGDGRVHGALAAVVALPVATILPPMTSPPTDERYLLLSAQGTVLADSAGTLQGQSVHRLLDADPAPFRAGHRSTAASAVMAPESSAAWWLQPTAQVETWDWAGLRVSRVGLPLPQWQVVVVQPQPSMGVVAWMAPWSWAPTGPGAAWGWALLGAAAVGLLWGAGQLVRVLRAGVDRRGQSRAVGAAVTHDTPTLAMLMAAVPVDTVLPGSVSEKLQSRMLALLEAVPSALVLEHEGRVIVATPQTSTILGYGVHDMQQLPTAQWLAQPEDLQAVQHALLELGSFEGVLPLRKKDGDTVWVHARVWSPERLRDATVWRLRLPWRQFRVAPLPGGAAVWHDPLTSVPNREAFLWGLQSWCSTSLQAVGQPPDALHVPTHGCLLFADVDHLGLLNEVGARGLGDVVLRYVGQMMARHVHPLGDVARLGGDEFAVLLPGISLAHGQVLAQQLCDAMLRWEPRWGGERHWVTLSIGVVAVDGVRHAPDDALRAADMACYEAKRRGRGQVAVGQVASRQADPAAQRAA